MNSKMSETLHLNEVPTTLFRDLEDAKQVEVLRKPDTGRDGEAIRSLAYSCHAEFAVTAGCVDADLPDPFDEVARGVLLPQVAEALHYTLRINGITRVCAHQLVRARIGWTFSEACTGDRDWRHGDFLIPRAWLQAPLLLEQKIQHCLFAKMLYAAELDGYNTLDGNKHWNPLGAPNEARLLLPPNLATFVHAEVNLGALASWYAARSCVQTQSWEMIILAERVKAAVISATPWAAPMFISPCERGKCWYLSTWKSPTMRANYYLPDAVHAKHMGAVDPSMFLHRKTHYEMSSGQYPFPVRGYKGEKRG